MNREATKTAKVFYKGFLCVLRIFAVNSPHTIFTTSPARQKATAAMPCASTAKNGGF